MIGYLKPANPGRSEKHLFRAYQCALCHTIGAQYGFVYRLFATPDLVFFHLFADLVSAEAGEPAQGRRACVLSPLGRLGPKLPVIEENDNTRLAAAFGVYIACEKLEDDFVDDGGLLRWLAWRAMSPGRKRARRVLLEAGFPVEAVEAQMEEQRLIEASGQRSLQEASQPTRRIARALFSSPARASDPERKELAEQIGEHIGAYLFYMDNLLDLERDLRAGGYNAIAAAGEGARVQALEGARAQVAALESIARATPTSPRGMYVRAVIYELKRKLARFESLSESARKRATLRTLDRRPSSLSQVQALAWVALALCVAFFYPRSVWAARTLGDSGLLVDTGGATGDTGYTPTDGGSNGGGDCFCNTCFEDICCTCFGAFPDGANSCGACEGVCGSCGSCGDSCNSCGNGC